MNEFMTFLFAVPLIILTAAFWMFMVGRLLWGLVKLIKSFWNEK